MTGEQMQIVAQDYWRHLVWENRRDSIAMGKLADVGSLNVAGEGNADRARIESRTNLYEHFTKALGLSALGVARWQADGIIIEPETYYTHIADKEQLESLLSNSRIRQECESRDYVCDFTISIGSQPTSKMIRVVQLVIRPIAQQKAEPRSYRRVQVAYGSSQISRETSCPQVVITNAKCEILSKLADFQSRLFALGTSRLPGSIVNDVSMIAMDTLHRSENFSQELATGLLRYRYYLSDRSKTLRQQSDVKKTGEKVCRTLLLKGCIFGIGFVALLAFQLGRNAFAKIPTLSAWLVAISIISGGFFLEHVVGVLWIKHLSMERYRRQLRMAKKLDLFRLIETHESIAEKKPFFEELKELLRQEILGRRFRHGYAQASKKAA